MDREFWGDIADLDDEAMAEQEDTAVRRASILQAGPSAEELDLLDRMQTWADRHTPNPDAKATALIGYLKGAPGVACRS